jgi:hypothetical protein
MNVAFKTKKKKNFQENQDIVARRSWQLTRTLRSFFFRMEHCKHLVVYWHNKGYLADKMSQKLLARPNGIASAYLTITNWMRALERGENILRHASGSGRQSDEEIDVLIALALDEESFHSVRSLATAIKSPPATVRQHLHAAGYVLRHLQLVPHTLSVSQKATRIGMAIQLKNVIGSAKHRGWRYFEPPISPGFISLSTKKISGYRTEFRSRRDPKR